MSNPEKKYYPAPEEFQECNVRFLTSGYITKRIFSPENPCTKTIPDDIFNLCYKFVHVPYIYEPDKDPVNFITEEEKSTCNEFKLIGNKYFKEKNYSQAIVYYNAAIFHNPRNYLIYSNRAFCYYLLNKFDDALNDIFEALQIEPTYSKIWYRNGQILEKIKRHTLAGISYYVANKLSHNWDDKLLDKRDSLYINFERFKKKILKLKKGKETMKKINTFLTNKPPPNFCDAAINILLKQGHKLDDNIDEKIVDLSQTDDRIKCLKQAGDMYRFAYESKYNYYINNNKLKKPDMFSGGTFVRPTGWYIAWSSIELILHNKRRFDITLSSDTNMSRFIQYCLPTSEVLIQLIKRTMAYQMCKDKHCEAPISLTLPYRIANRKNQYKDIEKAMEPFRTWLMLENINQSMENCVRYNTRIDGWNHLPYQLKYGEHGYLGKLFDDGRPGNFF